MQNQKQNREKIMTHKLAKGHCQFHTEVFPSQKDKFALLSHGQSPATMLITCSDSRIAPNLITGSEPGDIFVVRNVGNVVPSHESNCSEVAAIEFGVAVLGVQNIVVCGHSDCGALKAGLSGKVRGNRVCRRLCERHFSHG